MSPSMISPSAAPATRSRFAYVVQGSASEVRGIAAEFLHRRHVLIVWDTALSGALFAPDTSWAEGRRTGLEVLRSDPDWATFDYVVFMDADAAPTDDLLSRFEAEISRIRPAVAVPVVERLAHSTAGGRRRWQLALETDEQVQAIRTDLIDGFFLGSPYSTRYDRLSWWYPCIIHQSALRKHLWRSLVQINSVSVPNLRHGEYPNDFRPEFIDAELRRLGLRGLFPLGAYERHTLNGRRFLTKRRRRRVDRLVSRLLAALTPVLFVRWDRRRMPRPSSEYLGILRADD